MLAILKFGERIDMIGGSSTIGIGIVAALVLGGGCFILGILISARGQLLRAALDSTISISPFLIDNERALAIGIQP